MPKFISWSITKANVDAAMFSDGSVSVGVIIRNCYSVVLSAVSKRRILCGRGIGNFG